MSERITEHIDRNDISVRFEGVKKELFRQRSIFNHEDGDIYIARFCDAALSMIDEPPMKPHVIDYLAINPTDSPAYAVNKLLRAPQKQMIFNNPDLDYPKDVGTTEVWQQELTKIFSGKSPYDVGELMLDLYSRPAAANVSDRYQGTDLILSHLQERLGERPVVWDIGCSLNQGLRRMKRQSEIPFNAFEVVTPLTKNDAHPEFTVSDSEMTDRLRRCVGKVAIGDSVGIDMQTYYRLTNKDGEIVRVEDAPALRWGWASSFYPKELLDEKRVRNFKLLEEELPDVALVNADFSEDTQALEKILPETPPNVMIFSTVLYQKPQDIPKMLANARHFIAPGGIIIVQDFIQRDANTGEMRPIPSWFSVPYSYRTFVLDTARPEKGFMEVFCWKNGRCEKMMLGKDYDTFTQDIADRPAGC